MQLVKRPAHARGRTELDWLHSRHTFSFGSYHDPEQMGFRALRVINDDVVEPGRGFGLHAHRDAEILSYVLSGRLEHKDSMGNGSVIEAGNLQYMSAGDGVRHSEFNPSASAPVHFLQIWILPDGSGGNPRYAEKHLGSATRTDALTLVFSGRPRNGAIEIRADADVYIGRLSPGGRVTHHTSPSRGLWLHVVSGAVTIGSDTLDLGDSAAIEGVSGIELESRAGTEFLLFDLQ